MTFNHQAIITNTHHRDCNKNVWLHLHKIPVADLPQFLHKVEDFSPEKRLELDVVFKNKDALVTFIDHLLKTKSIGQTLFVQDETKPNYVHYIQKTFCLL